MHTQVQGRPEGPAWELDLRPAAHLWLRARWGEDGLRGQGRALCRGVQGSSDAGWAFTKWTQSWELAGVLGADPEPDVLGAKTRLSLADAEAPAAVSLHPWPSAPPSSKPLGPWSPGPLPLRGPTSRVQAAAAGRLGATLPRVNSARPSSARCRPGPARVQGRLSFPVSPRGCLYFPALRVSARCPALRDEASSDRDGLNHPPVTSREADKAPRLLPHCGQGSPLENPGRGHVGALGHPRHPQRHCRHCPEGARSPSPAGPGAGQAPRTPASPGPQCRSSGRARGRTGPWRSGRAVGILLPAPPGPPRPLTQATGHLSPRAVGGAGNALQAWQPSST